MRLSQGGVDFQRFQHRLAADGDSVAGTVETECCAFPPAFGQPEVRAGKAGIDGDRLPEQLTAAENLASLDFRGK